MGRIPGARIPGGRIPRGRIAGLVLCCLLVGLALPLRADPVAGTYGLIARRLSLMEPVAAWKWLHARPVEDLAREELVLAKATEAAVGAGLAPDGARAFFAAQIGAAKDIQSCWIARWHGGAAPAPESAPDLAEEIRPQLIEIGAALLAAIGTALAEGDSFAAGGSAAFDAAVAVDCLSDPHRDAVYRALTGLALDR